jgi:hypothetical protein
VKWLGTAFRALDAHTALAGPFSATDVLADPTTARRTLVLYE